MERRGMVTVHAPNNMKAVAKTLPQMESGYKSPNPTVVNVIEAQYIPVNIIEEI